MRSLTLLLLLAPAIGAACASSIPTTNKVKPHLGTRWLLCEVHARANRLKSLRLVGFPRMRPREATMFGTTLAVVELKAPR